MPQCLPSAGKKSDGKRLFDLLLSRRAPSTPKPVEYDADFVRLLSTGGEARQGHFMPQIVRHLDNLIAAVDGPIKAEFQSVRDGLQGLGKFLHKLDTSLYISAATWCIPVPIGIASAALITRGVRKGIEANDRTMIHLLDEDHAMLMEFVKEQGPDGRPKSPQTYTIRIYNSGLGIDEHHALRTETDSEKYETMFEVTGAELGGGKDKINASELRKLIAHQVGFNFVYGLEPPVSEIYDWARRKGTVNNHVPERVAQTPQKAQDCTIESVMAYLRNNLSERAYKLAKASLLEGAAAHLHALPADGSSAEQAKQLAHLELRAGSARARLARADRYDEQESGAQGKPWYAGRAPRAEVAKRLVEQTRCTGIPSYAISRDPDPRGDFALHWVERDGSSGLTPKVASIAFDPATSTFKAAGMGPFADLSEFVAAMPEGYQAGGPG